MTTGIEAAVGVGLGMAGAVGTAATAAVGRITAGRGVNVAAGAGAAGAAGAGTKTSVGTAAGVMMRATVCLVERQVEVGRSAAAANRRRARNRFKRAESYRRTPANPSISGVPRRSTSTAR